MSSKLSFILPSLRERRGRWLVDDIRARLKPDDYEIVLVAPYHVDQPYVNSVIETDQQGQARAVNTGVMAATGDVLIVVGDDTVLGNDWHHAIPVAQERVGNIACFKSNLVGQGEKVLLLHYGGNDYVCPCWPVFTRETLKTLPFGGLLFDPAYHAGFADGDLGLTAGANVKLCENASIYNYEVEDGVRRRNAVKWHELDKAHFQSKWGTPGQRWRN